MSLTYKQIVVGISILFLFMGCGGDTKDLLSLGNDNGKGDCEVVLFCDNLPTDGNYTYEELKRLNLTSCNTPPSFVLSALPSSFTTTKDSDGIYKTTTTFVEKSGIFKIHLPTFDAQNHNISYILSGDDETSFSISENGTLSLNHIPDFNSPIDSNRDNIYKVTITIDDGYGGEEILEFELTILQTFIQTTIEPTPTIIEPTPIITTQCLNGDMLIYSNGAISSTKIGDLSCPQPLEPNVTVTLYPEDKIVIKSEDTVINVVHTLDISTKEVTLLTGGADLIRGDFYITNIAGDKI